MLGKYLYLEFLFPVKDYLATLKLKEAIFDFALPLAISFSVYFFVLRSSPYSDALKEVNGYVVNFLGILIGFSIASVTLLITSSSKNVESLQENYSGNRRVGSQRINLFQLILITFTSVLMVEIFTLIFNLFFTLSIALNQKIREYWSCFYSVNLFLMMHIIFLNIRNITNLYFVFSTRRKVPQPTTPP